MQLTISEMLAIIYGTRPEFLKVKPLISAVRAAGIPCRVIRVNQHAGLEAEADRLLEVPATTDSRISDIGTAILAGLPSALSGCTVALVQGDTATAFYAALVAFQQHLKVVHLEAGMRTYDLKNPFPEEGFRQMISRISDLHLCPSLREACMLTMTEGVDKTRVHVIGNTILDLVASYGYVATQGREVLITLHRRENWSSYAEYLKALCTLATANTTHNFTFIAHPNPALKAELDRLTLPANFKVVPPLDHKQLMAALAACAFVITDSGGIQEEANFYGKHMYVLRQITERQAIGADRIQLISSPSEVAGINCTVPQHAAGHEYGDGAACIVAVQILKGTYF